MNWIRPVAIPDRSTNDGFQPRRFASYERDAIMSDDAMHRRYNRWWSRFEQPDPYDGSYELTDPQSFNRYAYVQNDPVNFVDPLGLDHETLGPPPPVPTLVPPPGPLPTIVTNIWAPRYRGGGGGIGGDFVPVDPSPEDDPGGPTVGGEPQNPVHDVVSPNDCYGLVSEVRHIGERTHVYLAGPKGSDMVQNFMDQLARRFTEYTSASELGIALSQVGITSEFNNREFSDVGFKSEFTDHVGPGASDNQVRHTVGGLIAGYLFGDGKVGRGLMDRREDMNTPSGQADTRLNRVTMPMGAQLSGPLGGSRAAGLADWIKNTLCNPIGR